MAVHTVETAETVWPTPITPVPGVSCAITAFGAMGRLAPTSDADLSMSGSPDVHAHHEPVMADEVTALLTVLGPGVVVDTTIGLGGHAQRVLDACGDDVVVVGLDRDADALAAAERRLAPYGDRVELVHAAFEDLTESVAGAVGRTGPVLGVLYDLGVSSLQLDHAERGFSFRLSGPLDMRMDRDQGASAADIVNTLDEEALAGLLRELGEERYARRVAHAIVQGRPLHTTDELADLVAAAVPASARAARLHPATRTFQALRIAVNDELSRLSASLPQALGLLALPEPDTSAPAVGGADEDVARAGRLVALAYHSLEDRIVKRFVADAVAPCVCPPELPVCGCGRVPLLRPLTRGAERPTEAEVRRNPRARSARLRAAVRTAAPPPA